MLVRVNFHCSKFFPFFNIEYLRENICRIFFNKLKYNFRVYDFHYKIHLHIDISFSLFIFHSVFRALMSNPIGLYSNFRNRNANNWVTLFVYNNTAQKQIRHFYFTNVSGNLSQRFILHVSFYRRIESTCPSWISGFWFVLRRTSVSIFNNEYEK